MKFSINQRVYVYPDDEDMFEFTAQIVGYNKDTQIYEVKDEQNNSFYFKEGELMVLE